MTDLLKRAKFFSAFVRRDFVHLNLQLLYQCNFRCRICDFWKPAYQDKPQLSAADVKVMVKKLPAPMIVSIGGGEPLMHPELLPIIRILGEKHFPVMICNGWYITPEKARELFEDARVMLDRMIAERWVTARAVFGLWPAVQCSADRAGCCRFTARP